MTSAEPLVDIGVNLTHKRFRADLSSVIERAVAAGVTTLIATGTNVQASAAALALAQSRRGVVVATAGVHPHHAKDWDDDALDAVRELATSPEVVAIGECGLDYNRNFSPPDAQRRALVDQITLAVELGLPLFLHERDAHADLAAILAEHPDARGVVHCFTGDRPALERYLAMGLHIGITGWICDERRGTHLRELVGAIPPDRLMIETDAPFLLPRDLSPRPRDGRNEPAFLPHIAAAVAQAAGRPVDDVARHTTATARRLFALG